MQKTNNVNEPNSTFLLEIVLVSCADTPKSATCHKKSTMLHILINIFLTNKAIIIIETSEYKWYLDIAILGQQNVCSCQNVRQIPSIVIGPEKKKKKKKSLHL
ncbi:hypothetical protein HanRHA438_Chr15g0729441 [Helianthus annuus]|nr:hypothetical protein HanRHA438_Chr15g0729441 [Helianthus annuus]